MIKASRAAGETEREGGRPVEAIQAGRETGGQHMGELKGERGEWRRERSGWGGGGDKRREESELQLSAHVRPMGRKCSMRVGGGGLLEGHWLNHLSVTFTWTSRQKWSISDYDKKKICNTACLAFCLQPPVKAEA